jgi:hypothetical protein
MDARTQMSNPVRILTSGVERVAERPFFSNGKWRMCDRVRWWDEYTDEACVIIGHYWRRLQPVAAFGHESSPPEVFGGIAPHDWLGPRRNVFCVDYSVGGRYLERKRGATTFSTRLCALRWPERQLCGESGPVSPDLTFTV